MNQRGVYIVRQTDGNTIKTTKVVKQ